jgi:hypothetical protein
MLVTPRQVGGDVLMTLGCRYGGECRGFLRANVGRHRELLEKQRESSEPYGQPAVAGSDSHGDWGDSRTNNQPEGS